MSGPRKKQIYVLSLFLVSLIWSKWFAAQRWGLNEIAGDGSCPAYRATSDSGSQGELAT